MLFVLGLFAIKVLSNNLGWSSWKEHVHRYSHRFTFSHSSPQKQTGKSTEADHHVRHSEADRLHRKHSSLQDTSPSNQGIIQSFIMNNTFRLRQTHVKLSFTNKFYYTVRSLFLHYPVVQYSPKGVFPTNTQNSLFCTITILSFYHCEKLKTKQRKVLFYIKCNGYGFNHVRFLSYCNLFVK